jgi:hypothetical protein
MTHQPPPDAIADEEDLARYIFHKNQVRADLTVKPDALIPHPYPDTSVTRHLGLNDADVWAAGRVVEQQRNLPLVGRADNWARDYRSQKLVPQADPVPGNPHHAVVVGWPADKPAQKSLAQQIVARTRYTPASSA